jgi:hypothetical protein
MELIKEKVALLVKQNPESESDVKQYLAQLWQKNNQILQKWNKRQRKVLFGIAGV